MGEDPGKWVGLGLPCRTLAVGQGSWGLQEPWEVFEQGRGAPRGAGSKLFLGLIRWRQGLRKRSLWVFRCFDMHPNPLLTTKDAPLRVFPGSPPLCLRVSESL